MADFSPSYTEPGVYVKYADAAVPAAPAGALIPVIVGTGKKVVTITEAVVRGPSTTDTLTHTSTVGFSSGPLLATITDRLGTSYVVTTNWTEASGVITWVTGAPTAGSTYYVTYTYNKAAADFQPYLTSRIDDIISLYGPAQFQTTYASATATDYASSTTVVKTTTLTTTSTTQYVGYYVKVTAGTNAGEERYIVSHTNGASAEFTVSSAFTAAIDATSVFSICDVSNNTVSIGASIAVTQGAQYIMVVQATDDITGAVSMTAPTGWAGAIGVLSAQECYAIAVMKGVLSTSPMWSTVGSGLKTHCETYSSLLEKKFRVCVIGAPVGSTAANLATSAVALTSERAAYLSPSDLKLTLNGVQRTVDGSYLAAAVLGIVCDPRYTWGEPISGKSIIAFDDITDNFTRTEKNTMAASGVMVIEKKNAGDIKIRHALSTKTNTVANQEFKVIRIKDGLSKFMIVNLEGTYTNTRNIGAETASNIKAFMKFLLDSVVARQDITEYTNIVVAQSTLDSRQINISFMIKPTYDINWILITFGVAV